MLAGLVLVLLVQAVYIQSAHGQCINRNADRIPPNVQALPTSKFTVPTFASVVPTKPGACRYSKSLPATAPTVNEALPVTSISPMPLESLAVESENFYEGTLGVAGELPFLGTVGLDGVVPSAGIGAVNHACGSAPRITDVNLGPGLRSAFSSGFDSAVPFGYNALGNYLNAGNYGAGINWRNTGLANGIGGLANGIGGLGALGYNAYDFGRNGYNGIAGFGSGLYKGFGEGNVEVVGELPVSGETVVIGEVPILGTVTFKGEVPAYGTVSISGFCSCGCGNNVPYF